MAELVLLATVVCALFMGGFAVGVLIVVGALGHWRAGGGPDPDGPDGPDGPGTL
jgi:hypothetical protein